MMPRRVILQRAVSCVAVGLCLTANLAGDAASKRLQSDRSTAAYEELIRRYQGGETGDAVRNLATWSAEDVRRAARASQVEESSRIVPRSDAARDMRLLTVAALHAEAGIESADRERYQVHAEVGEAAVRELAGRRLAVPFCRTWYLTVSNFWTVLGDLVRAEAALTSSRRLLGADAELLVALGTVNEMWSGPFGAPFLKRDMSVDLGGMNAQSRVQARASRQRDGLLGRARNFYREAVGVAPAGYEARLRLGRVGVQLGHGDEAAKELERCLAPEAPPAIRYLAGLFLGQLRESANDLAAAERAYRAARASVPPGLAATLALARVLDITGRGEAATAAVAETLASPAGPTDLDPWWLYQMGQLTDLSARLDLLRALASRRRPGP